MQPSPRRYLREPQHGMLGGVAAGLAEHLGLPVLAVRIGFLLLAAAGGAGVLMYAAFWVLVPADPAAGDPTSGMRVRRASFVVLAAVATVVVWLGLLPGGQTALGVFAVVVGATLIWRQADESHRMRWRATAGGRRGQALRLVAGGLLLVGGLAGFLVARGQIHAVRQGLLSTAVVLVGVGLLTGPWWFRMAADLREERRERIRSQERAEVAAHVHDSVLQTLTLIQKASGDPDEVARLARSQERELRTWLYRADRDEAASFAGVLEQVAAEVEQDHGVAVDVVVVGDCPLDPRGEAVVAAAREAMVNAAKHSGRRTVSLYAEVEDSQVSAFVRDRGAGFDPAGVADDRHGLRSSVVGRMERHGGRAEIRAVPGEGTEVRLVMPRG